MVNSKDKYKSHDWGMEGVTRAGKKGGPEMSVSEKEIPGGHDRGLSIETGSPYILPVGLHGSRNRRYKWIPEWLGTLSLSFQTGCKTQMMTVRNYARLLRNNLPTGAQCYA